MFVQKMAARPFAMAVMLLAVGCAFSVTPVVGRTIIGGAQGHSHARRLHRASGRPHGGHHASIGHVWNRRQLAEPWLYSGTKTTKARTSANQQQTSAHELGTTTAEDISATTTTAAAAATATAASSVEAALAAAEAAAAAANRAAMQASAALAAAKAATAAAIGIKRSDGTGAEDSGATTLGAGAAGSSAAFSSAASSAAVAVGGGSAAQSSHQHAVEGVVAGSTTGSDESAVQALYDYLNYLDSQYDNGLVGAVQDGEEEWANEKQAHGEAEKQQQDVVSSQQTASAEGSSISGVSAGGAGAGGEDPADVLADPDVWFGEDYWLRQNELTHLKDGQQDALKAHEDIILGSSGDAEPGAAGGATDEQAGAQHPEEFSVYGNMQQLVSAEGKQQQDSALTSEDGGVLPHVDTVELLDYDAVEEMYFITFEQDAHSSSTAHIAQGGDNEQPSYEWYELDADPYYDFLYDDSAAVVRVTAGEGPAAALIAADDSIGGAAVLGGANEQQQQQQQQSQQQLFTTAGNHAAAMLSSDEDLPVVVPDNLVMSLVGAAGEQQQQQQAGSANGVAAAAAAGEDAVLSTSNSNGAAAATTAAVAYSYDISAKPEHYYDMYDDPLFNDPWYDYELQQFKESWESYAYGYYDPISIPDDSYYDAGAAATLDSSASPLRRGIDHDDDEYVLPYWRDVRQSQQHEQQQDASTTTFASAAAADANAAAVVRGGDGFEFTWEDAASVLLAGDDGAGGAVSGGGAIPEAAAAVAAFADAVFGDAAARNEQQLLLRGAFLGAVERWQQQESSSSSSSGGGGGSDGGEIQDSTGGMSRAELLSRAGELLAATAMAHLGAAGGGAAAGSVGYAASNTEHELPLPHGFESHEHAMLSGGGGAAFGDTQQDAEAWEEFLQHSKDQQQQRLQYTNAAAVVAGASTGASLEATSAGVTAATALPQQQQPSTDPQPSRSSALFFMAGTAFGIAAMLLLAGMAMAYYTIGGWSYGLPPASPPAAARARKPATTTLTSRRQTRGSRSASVSSWSSDNSSTVAGPPHSGWASMFGAATSRFGTSAGAKHVSYGSSDRLDAPLLMLSHDSELESDGAESSAGSLNTHISEHLQVHPEPSATWSINHLAPLPSYHPEQHQRTATTTTTTDAAPTASTTSPRPSHDLPHHTLRVRTTSISTDPTAAPASPRTAPAPTTGATCPAPAPTGHLPSSARALKSPVTRVLPVTPVSASAAASPRHHLSPFVVAVSAARLNSPLSPPLWNTNSPAAAAAESPRRHARAGSGSGTATILVNAAYAEYDQDDDVPLCRSSCSFTAGDAQLANLRRRVHNSYASHPNSPTIGQGQSQQQPRSPLHAAVYVHEAQGPYAAASPARHSVSWSTVGYSRTYGNAMGGGPRPVCPVEMAAGGKLLPSSPLAAVVAAAAAGAAPCNSPVAARRSRLASVVEAV